MVRDRLRGARVRAKPDPPPTVMARPRIGGRGRAASLLILTLFLFFPVSCGLQIDPRAAGDVSDDAEENAARTNGEGIEVTLEPIDGFETRGTVTFVSGPAGGMEVELVLRELPDPGGAYIGAIYRGSCDDEVGASEEGERLPGWGARPVYVGYQFAHGGHDEPADDEDVVQSLTSIVSGPDGNGSSLTPLPVSAQELLSGGPKYVDVHSEDGTSLACADLPVARPSET